MEQKSVMDVERVLAMLTDEEIREIGKRMGVDYSHTSWDEEKRMIIEDAINGVSDDCFDLGAWLPAAISE